MEEITSLIANVGFPMAVSVYLLVRIEGRIGKLIECINELTNVIAGLGNIKR